MTKADFLLITEFIDDIFIKKLLSVAYIIAYTLRRGMWRQNVLYGVPSDAAAVGIRFYFLKFSLR